VEELKSNIKQLLKSIFQNFPNPILALDSGNNVIEYNNLAKEIFRIGDDYPLIKDLISLESFSKLNELIQSSIFNKSFVTYEDFYFKLKDSSELVTNLNLNYVSFENDFFVLISLNANNTVDSLLNFTKIDIRQGIQIEKILDPKIRKVIKEVKSFFPFTITTKERLKKILDEFDELIRIKDIQGKFIIVNSAYAKSLGVSAAQLEGKNESEYIPIFIKDFFVSIDEYLSKTNNYVIIEGIQSQGISDTSDQQVIEIPISDYQNNIIAVITITQNKLKSLEKSVSAELYLSGEIIEIFPKPLAYIDYNGKFLFTSRDFCKLLSEESNLLNGMYISDVLPSEINEIIKVFLNLDSANKEFYVNNDLIPGKKEESKYKVFLNKISFQGLNLEGIFIFIDDSQTQVDLNQLIKERGRMFDILIQNNPEPIFIYDIENLRFLEVNDSALQLYSYSREEFLQMDLTDLYTPEDIQTLLGSSSDDSAVNIFTGPYKHKNKHGESIFVEISKTKFKFNDRDCFFNIVKNITSKLEIEKKNQLFKAAFENTSDIIFVTDANGFINFINKSGTDLLGYSLQEIQNTSFTAVVKDEDRAMINTTVFTPDLKDTVSLLLDIKKAEGKYLDFEIKFIPIFDYMDQIESFTIILKKQIKKSSDLMEESKQIVREVDTESLDKSEPLLPDPNFLSGVFHEILTPMNVILGFAQELSDSIDSPTSDQKEASDLIRQNKVKLLSTMNTVVEYSELLQQKSDFKFAEVAVIELIDKIDKKIPDLINTPETQFSYGKISSSLNFITDPYKFELLISSIIKVVGRLIKEKKIYLSAFPYNDEQFIILICDNYNICTEYLLSKLNLIFTGNNELRDIGAPKLTTHLAKTLLSKLGGKFILDDNFGGGFVFPNDVTKISDYSKFESADEKIEKYIKEQKPATEVIPIDSESEYLFPHSEIINESITESTGENQTSQKSTKDIDKPLAEDINSTEGVLSEENKEKLSSTPQNDTRESKQKIDISTMTCLYIEDQVDSQILFKVQMKGLKELKFAVSFEEALPLLESRTFDFIVMDINLQGEYNGLDALKIINKMPSHEKTPIIAVTAYVLPGDKEKFIATGFNDFVSKPIFREKMIESLERIFAK
jgi:PAS domain S-box-containing protein